MNQKRIEDLFEDFKNALKRLKEALDQDPSQEETAVDGTIQRFEFTFELAWKLAKAYLSYQGIEATTPRTVIKEAYKAKLFENGDGWIDMLEDRNKTAHIYDEDEALKIYQKIKDKHFVLLTQCQNAFNKLQITSGLN